MGRHEACDGCCPPTVREPMTNGCGQVPNATAQDVLIRQIREAIAEENRKDIIERIWKGRQARIRRGLRPVATYPTAIGGTATAWLSHQRDRGRARLSFDCRNLVNPR